MKTKISYSNQEYSGFFRLPFHEQGIRVFQLQPKDGKLLQANALDELKIVTTNGYEFLITAARNFNHLNCYVLLFSARLIIWLANLVLGSTS